MIMQNLQFVVLANWVENIEDAAIRQGAARVGDVAGDDRDLTRAQSASLALYGELELALEHVCDLLVRVAVQGKLGAGVDIPVGEGHGLGVDKAHVKARYELASFDVVEFITGHLAAEGSSEVVSAQSGDGGGRAALFCET